MRLFLPILTFLIFLPIGLHAQSYKQPEPPESLSSLVKQGSQLFYLGEFEGMHGWALIRQGKPEFFYETKDRSAMIMGLMFNSDGQMVTMSQLSALKKEIGEEMYATTGGLPAATETIEDTQDETPPTTDTPTSLVGDTPPATTNGSGEYNLATPAVSRAPTQAEKMYADLITANWVTMNPQGERDMFIFVDPDCPHCQTFINSSDEFLTRGKIRLRIIPVGASAESARRSAVLLASANPAERLKRYMSGDEAALPAPETINLEAVESNIALLSRNRFNVTPVIVYKTDQGKIRLIRGRPTDYNVVLKDMNEN